MSGSLDAHTLYELIMARARHPGVVQQVALGLSWSLASVRMDDGGMARGLCFSPTDAPRNLSWPGSLAGRDAAELVSWLLHWNTCDATVGAAVANAIINYHSPLPARAQALHCAEAPHLAVFEHFKGRLAGSRVAIIGRYPGLDRYQGQFDFHCIERRPGPGDLPDAAADWILPRSDWVFITASSMANKTLPHLLNLSRHAQVVLMGPSMPWLAEWADFGVNYLAGVQIRDAERLLQILLEGGGTNIFGESVAYQLLPL
ncbi:MULTISPECIES: DUF364 domain-containing protein [unclassified Ketobacter]|jgi:uncharacterized protein|uniref:DUF364 domain-containing protein n=1 Tax=unclassified Ketobacter TaxID=2639109 RepID=UPI0025C0841A|nr:MULTISPECIES: DUF364 domain-containing protein [unclassified Ketobacter]MCK5789788.1 DUF364 domain-containing protein [Ketobacter sp.]